MYASVDAWYSTSSSTRDQGRCRRTVAWTWAMASATLIRACGRAACNSKGEDDSLQSTVVKRGRQETLGGRLHGDSGWLAKWTTYHLLRSDVTRKPAHVRRVCYAYMVTRAYIRKCYNKLLPNACESSRDHAKSLGLRLARLGASERYIARFHAFSQFRVELVRAHEIAPTFSLGFVLPVL